jgi:hypothetical protein
VGAVVRGEICYPLRFRVSNITGDCYTPFLSKKKEFNLMGKRIITFLIILFLVDSPFTLAGDGEIVVKDVAGRVIRREIVRGDTTYVRSPDGRLLLKRTRKGDRIVVTDIAGRVIETMEIKGDICVW